MRRRSLLFTLALTVSCGACAEGSKSAVAESTSETTEPPDAGAGASASVDVDRDGFAAPQDCDDGDADVHPGSTEVCNGQDDDCNGTVDDVPAFLDAALTSVRWSYAGTARLSGEWAQLTGDGPNEVGALWWSAAYVFDAFEATGSFWIQEKEGGADGLAFAWVPGGDYAAVGSAGEAFGVPAGGWAIAIDTFQNPGQPPVPFLTVVNGTTGAQLARQGLPNVRDGQAHLLRVRLADGKVSAWVDSVAYFFEFPLPSYTPFAGRWGFGAATGGAGEAHAVRGVTMSFPRGQGCVP